MVFYELFCISRTRLVEANLKDLVKQTSLIVMNKGGVVRSLKPLGEKQLPYRIRKHQEYHVQGFQWTMHFDSNPSAITELNKRLKVDPRVLRHAVIRLGSKLEDIIASPEKTGTKV
ncbi:MAG: 30S ribosomal protein S6 [Benniella sp.]|nr:MAG: 30S ribosomal protein S6 [Benniella sp.]